ncbi:Beta-phosphoglucomutase [Spironucleus salmonicida]|nr:Beta-phosphoglucomutase [Spironucleus salmonicida]
MLEDMKYFVFDFDGTLINSIPVWEKVHGMVFENYNIPYLEKQHLDNIQGLSTPDCSKFIITKYNLTASVEEVKDIFISNCIKLFQQVEFINNGDNFLRMLIEKKIPVGLATACPHAVIESFLSRYPDIRQNITIVTCEDVGASKPSPKVFLECMRQIGGNPQETVVFEDTVAGMQGARASGGRVIGILSERNQMDQKREICDFLVDDYTELLKEL